MNVPISIKGKPGALLITSHPNDEMAEIWDGIITQLQIGAVIALVLFLITTRVVSRALAPIQALSQAMTKIEAGATTRACSRMARRNSLPSATS